MRWLKALLPAMFFGWCVAASAAGDSATEAFLQAMQDGDFSEARDALAKGANVRAVDENGKTALHYAAEEGDSLMIALLVSRGAAIEAQDEEGRRPLHYAVIEGRLAGVQLLLDKAAQPQPDDFEGVTPMHLAAREGHDLVVKLLMDRGASPDAVDDTGAAPLFWAVRDNQKRTIRFLLKAGVAVNAQDEEGRTALHEAVKAAGLEEVALLLQAGANPLLADYDGVTPLDLARKQKKPGLEDLLEKRAATVRARSVLEPPQPYLMRIAPESPEPVKQFFKAVASGNLETAKRLAQGEPALLDAVFNTDGVRAIHLAAAVGDMEILQWLLEMKQDPKAATITGITPLHAAAVSFSPQEYERLTGKPSPVATGRVSPPGQVAVAALLLQKRVNAGARDAQGYTPVQRGVFYGNTGLVAVVADLGGSVNDAGAAPQRYSPLHLAAAIGDKNMSVLLVERGARLNAPARNFKTPLDLAVAGKRSAVIGYLTDKGAKRGRERDSGKTQERPPDADFLKAAETGDTDLLKILLRKGANPKAVNEAGRSALHLAMAAGSTAAVSLLVEHGLDLNAKDAKGLTPLLTGILFKKQEPCLVLVEKGADVGVTLPVYGGALHGAVFNQMPELVKAILDKGAPVDIVTDEGDTPLHFAVRKGWVNLAVMLMQAGADPSKENKRGESPRKLGLNSNNAGVSSLFKSGSE